MKTRRNGTAGSRPFTALRALVLVLGPCFVLVSLLTVPPGDLSLEAWRLLGLMSWMVLWWLAEIVPLAATALLPLPLMPLLDVMPERSVATNYAHPLILLFLGGFLVAAAIGRWGLHRRLALRLLLLAGDRPSTIIATLMLATAFLSMAVSNTATAVMMYAVGVSLIDELGPRLEGRERHAFGVTVMLGIAYSASIGGLGTLIGSPPNLLLAGYLEQNHGIVVDFRAWLAIGLPLVAVLLPLVWLWLTRFAFPQARQRLSCRELVQRELSALGPMGPGERAVTVVFLLTALGWILRPQLASLSGLPLSDTTIALLGALLLFSLPLSLQRRTFALDWDSARGIPWDVLLLFGGGLALASAIESTGLSATLGGFVAGLDGVPPFMILVFLAATIVLLGELASNTASAATFLPVAGAAAVGLGQDVMVFTVPVALAASTNFMLPVATPPNAIVFAWDGMRLKDMLRGGIDLDLLALVVILLLAAIAWRTG